jgi:DNA-binding YbaB/EbfC family protein
MDLTKLMKQAQRMQKDMAKVEEELSTTIYEGESQAVKCMMNGDLKLISIDVDSSLLNIDDKEMLQDMIILAVNEASGKASSDRNTKLGDITGGMKVPGLM